MHGHTVRSSVRALSLVLFLPAAAQAPVGPGSSAADAERRAIEALAFLVGEWKGSGWIRMGPGDPQPFQSAEVVKPILDGHALLVEGRHFAQPPGAESPVPVHHAVALLSWDGQQQSYRFQSHVVGRGAGSHRGLLVDDAFVWELEAGGRTMRYTIRIDEAGRWHEVGETLIEGDWRQFFEMTLARVGG